MEVDVQGEMEEASVKEEEEETKVVEAAPAGVGEAVAQGVDGAERCRGHPGPAMGPGSPGWPPPPQTWTPPSSSTRRVRYGLSGFCWCGCTTGCWGRGGGYG